MRAFQETFPRLKDRFTYEEKEAHFNIYSHTIQLKVMIGEYESNSS